MVELCTKEQLADIYAEFDTNEEFAKKDVRHLIEWLEKQPHLPNIKDESFLVNFLLRSKNQMERAKRMLERYYTSRVTMGDVFRDRDPRQPEIENAIKYASYIPLPKLTADGYRVVIYRIFQQNNENIPSLTAYMKAIQMELDLSIKEDYTKGTIMVYDYENTTMPLVVMQLTALRRIIEIGINAIPFRVKKTYLLNLTPMIEPVIRFGKSLVKKDIADRMEVWKKNATDLVEVLPKHILPSNYGGQEKSIEELRDSWYEYLTKNANWFLSEEHVKADLSRKPTCNHCKDFNIYGMEGTFRKIAID